MTPQQSIIIGLLQDRQKHCPTVELFMKDDRTRISELRKMGYVFNEGAGFCKEPKHNHSAKVKLRQLTAEPGQKPILNPIVSENVAEFLKKYPSKVKEPVPSIPIGAMF